MDLRSFFQNGYSVSKIDRSVADAALEAIPRQNFHYPDQVLTEKEHPVYYKETGLFYCECTTTGTATNPPLAARGINPADIKFFNRLWESVAMSADYRWFRECFGPISRFSKQFHNFNKNDYLKFHFDYKDAVPIISILYVGDDDFTEADGGYLEVGRCEVTEDFEIVHESIQKTGLILPNHGTLVTINNLTPYFVHSVAKLISQKTRYSVICQFGYKENELYSLQSRGWEIR
jgi:hypothetical protein